MLVYIEEITRLR